MTFLWGGLLVLLLAIPLCVLYEVGIFFAQFIEKRKAQDAVGSGASE